jgi:hypothetical protein
MHHHKVKFKQVDQSLVAFAKVIHPYRGVDENAFHR